MKIKRRSISLTTEGLSKHISEFECTKTANGFIVNKESSFGSKTTRVKYNEILLPDTLVREHLYYIIHRYAWYFEEDGNKAEKILMKSISEVAIKQANIANKLVQHLDQQLLINSK